MANRKTASQNIWRNAFKSGGEIEGTKVKNGMQSKSIKSSINTSGRATIAYSLTAAIMALVQGRVSFGETSYGNIWAECKSQGNRLYVLNYQPALKLEAFAVENKQPVPFEFVNSTFAHWSVFIPRIIELLKNTKGEFFDNFKMVLDDYRTNGVVTNNSPLFILNDYLYESRHNYIQENKDVNVVSPCDAVLKTDLTEIILGIKGTFEFGALASAQGNQPSGQKKTTQNNTLNAKLPWNRPLTPEEEELIPKFDLSVMTISPQIKKLAVMVKEEHDSEFPVNNIILYGEAGAGKSTAAKILAQLWGLPYRFINLSLNSEESDLIGTYRPKEDGTFEFFEPAFAETFRNGGVIELMEVNYARPGALGVLNSALDDTAKITLGNGEIVSRHPNCIIIATTNVDYAGCQRMNEALKDRFHQIVHIEKPSNGDLVVITMRASGNTDAVLVAKMVDAVQKISTKMVEEQIIGGVCSTRQLINWARDVKYTNDPIESAKATILPGVSLDLNIQQEIIDTILKPMF